MENHSADQTIILSMKISCCEGCPKILKKKLLKMQGVESVAIDTENDLVYVKGTINPTTLHNKVAKLGKAVQVEDNYTRNNNDFATRNNGKMHKNCCCKDGRHASKKKVEEEHKNETQPIPTVDERICRDIFCKTHAFLHRISDEVPHERNSLSGLFYGGGLYPYQAGYGYGYGPRPYGYVPPPRLGPQHPFGYQYRH